MAAGMSDKTGEPVAWRCALVNSNNQPLDKFRYTETMPAMPELYTPLYAHPPVAEPSSEYGEAVEMVINLLDIQDPVASRLRKVVTDRAERLAKSVAEPYPDVRKAYLMGLSEGYARGYAAAEARAKADAGKLRTKR